MDLVEFKNKIEEVTQSDQKIENQIIDFEEELSNYQMLNLDFYKSKFDSINIIDSNFEKASFVNIEFLNCNFSNTTFENCSFIRCNFNNCKFTGTVFLKSRFDTIEFKESNFCYSNFSLSMMNNIKYKDSIMRNMYFEENKHKKLEIDNSDLTGANFFKTSLKDIDLSTNNISALVVGLDDIKGAKIDSMQALDLIGLLGVKIK